MIDSDARAVLSHYRLGANQVRSIEPLGSAGGWSGSRLWRIVDEAGCRFCLRRWPAEHPSRDRLRLIHAVLGLVRFEMHVVAVPIRNQAGATFVELDSHFWELTPWMPGTADFHQRSSRPRLRMAMQTLARFHELASRYQRRLGVAPAVADRQRRLLGMRDKGLSLFEASLAAPLGTEIDSAARRALLVIKKSLAQSSALAALGEVPELPLQPAIRDIHHDHVLFTGDEVTGIIDFGAMRIDTPLTDVARLVGSLVGDDQQERQFAFDAYSELRPLSNADRKLIDVLDESGVVLGGLNWLKWLYVERRDMGPSEPIVKRLGEIVERLARFAHD